MSTSIKTCPGCSSLILSDTSECPECGTVFDEKIAEANAIARAAQEMKTQNMYDNCKKCGSSVRSGLVRCWNCNAFMRKDVENKYAEMMSSPQPIIFSETNEGDVQELIPARVTSKGEEVYDAVGDDDGFELGTGVSSQQSPTTPDSPDDEFELDSDQAAPAKAEAPPAQPAQPAAEKPAAPSVKQPAAQETPTSDKDASKSDTAETKPTAEGSSDKPEEKELDDDDFVGMAINEAKETKSRNRRRVQQSRRRRVLVPCTTCGAWIRIFQDQAGRTVRCQKCKTPFIVPQLKKKDKEAASKQKASSLDLEWLEDVSLHVVNPTDIVLKPGSLEKLSEPGDLTFHDGQMFVVKFAPPAKKGLFAKSGGVPEVPDQRKQIRDAIGRAGHLNSVPVGERFAVSADDAKKLRLVQPVTEAHASMFAGVPVFGPGKIAVYLPIALPDGQQLFLSMTLSQSRQVAEALKENFDIDLQLADNGVPATEQKEMLKCKLLEIPVEAVRNLEYYENDPAFELEMTGYRCGTCQIAISEDGRARKKLGGASGKGIAKAKCPGCSSKMGDQKTYRISKAPGDSEEEA